MVCHPSATAANPAIEAQLRSCGASAVEVLLAGVGLHKLWHLVLDTILRRLHWIEFRPHAAATTGTSQHVQTTIKI